MDLLAIATGVLGGIGLFLLGMRLMTEGLRLGAGHALRSILERGTATRARAVLAGIGITALVQSSSAVTVAVIGFANAGLLSLAQAVAVVFGSNVGTTITGWLVALVGFNVDVKAMALPGIGVGMAMRLASAGRAGGFGEALVGFGVFFLGIDVLKGSLGGLQESIAFAGWTTNDLLGVVAFTLAGFALTVVMQSSSAALAVILTSVGQGVVSIESGACLVIGANAGTTSTAAIAAIGATSNAKRVAVAHIAFNAVTGVVALVTLPLLLLAAGRFREALGLGSEPAAVVAGFHTLFNVLGVALMWPLTSRLVGMLERRFRTPEEDEARARYLDRNILATPVLAVGALGLELARLGAIAREMAVQALRGQAAPAQLRARRESLGRLLSSTGDFVTALQRARLPHELGGALPLALRIGRYYAEAAELAERTAEARAGLAPLGADLDPQVRSFEGDVLALLDVAGVEVEGASREATTAALERAERRYAELKNALLQAGSEGKVPVDVLVAQLDRLSDVRRLAQQAARGAASLWKLGDLASGEAGAGNAAEGGDDAHAADASDASAGRR